MFYFNSLFKMIKAFLKMFSLFESFFKFIVDSSTRSQFQQVFKTLVLIPFAPFSKCERQNNQAKTYLKSISSDNSPQC